MGNPSPFGWAVVVIVAVFHLAGVASAVDFLFNYFIDGSNQLQLIYVDGPVIRLTHDNTQSSSVGRAFFPAVRIHRSTPAGGTTIASFSTSFFFSIMHDGLRAYPTPPTRRGPCPASTLASSPTPPSPPPPCSSQSSSTTGATPSWATPTVAIITVSSAVATSSRYG